MAVSDNIILKEKKMCKIGFTGTRHGMTEQQKKALTDILKNKEFEEFHHGDCVGSDQQAHDIVDQQKLSRNIKIIGHPPKYNKYRAYCRFDFATKPADYLTRNKDIVNNTDFLIATPDMVEKLHSGTWSTIRYARAKKKRIYIIHKSGRITIDG
jgi:hypothetical protein